MNRGALSNPSFIGSSKKTSDEKKGSPNKCKGARKKKNFDENRGNPDKHIGAQ
jgi:hypothetical protein